MTIKSFLKDRAIIIVIVAITLIYFNWGWLVSSFSPADQTVYSAILNVQRYVETYIKEEYWPDEYRADKNDVFDIQGFGRRNADNYGMSWEKDGMVLVIAVGDEKGESEKPIGFFMHINIEGKQPLGLELASRFIKNIPQEGWKHSELKEGFGMTSKSQISSVVWREGNTSLITETEYVWYADTRTGFLPNKEVREITTVDLRISTPNDPIEHGDLSDYQSRRLKIHGE